MATSPRDRLAREQKRIDRLTDDGEITPELQDALFEWTTALDSEKQRYKFHDREGNIRTLAVRSIEGYLQCLRSCAERGIDVTNTTVDDFNDHIDGLHDDDGYADSTCTRYQSAARSFFTYHNDLGVDPEDIVVYTPERKPRHDELDMYTAEEVEALRQTCGATGMPTRNRALLELLIYTGQRIRALVTLRIEDVRPNEGPSGYIYLNPDVDGLKGALGRGRRRPMFGARKYVRDWLNQHPNPESGWLFIGNPSHWKTDPNDHWAEVSADHVLRRLGESAGIEKPMNPHNFRHYFVTVMKRDYDLSDDEIRALIGVKENSDIFKTTYSHVTNDDYIRKAEEKTGHREAEQQSPLTPKICPTCGEHLQPHWRSCPACREVFAPDERVQSAAENLFPQVLDALADPERGDGDREALRVLADLLKDDSALAEADPTDTD